MPRRTDHPTLTDKTSCLSSPATTTPHEYFLLQYLCPKDNMIFQHLPQLIWLPPQWLKEYSTDLGLHFYNTAGRSVDTFLLESKYQVDIKQWGQVFWRASCTFCSLHFSWPNFLKRMVVFVWPHEVNLSGIINIDHFNYLIKFSPFLFIIWYNLTQHHHKHTYSKKYLYYRANSAPLWFITSFTKNEFCRPVELDCVILNELLLFCLPPVPWKINKIANKLPGYHTRWHSNEWS